MPDATRRRLSPLAALLVVVLVTLLAVALWGGWVYGVRHLIAAADTEKALAEAKQSVAQPRPKDVEVEAALPAPTAGEPLWILDVPRLGLTVPVLAGTDDEQLSRGVGWYPTTNLPGEPGNTGLAGYAVNEGRPFARLAELRVGDEVRLETRVARYVYEVRVAPEELTVDKSASWVLDPVPGKDFEPHESILTLTADQDLVPTDDRAVGFAVLKNKELK